MCKVFIMSKITDETRSDAMEFSAKMGRLMSSANRDGLGYAAVDSAGNLFGERWLTNAAAFPKWTPKADPNRNKIASTFAGVLSLYDGKIDDDAVEVESEYNSFGQVNLEDITSITLHTRMATSAKGMQNTHPFVTADTSLIHNGVINNVEDFKFTLSSCDSESILISYLESGVNLNPYKALNNMSSSLVGYYACAVYGRDSEGRRVLDLFKVHNPNFVISWIEELDSFVFATSGADIKSACEYMGFSEPDIKTMLDGRFVRMLPGTNEVVETWKFDEGKRYDYTGYRGTTTTSTAVLPTPDKTIHKVKSKVAEEFAKTKGVLQICGEGDTQNVLSSIMDRYAQ